MHHANDALILPQHCNSAVAVWIVPHLQQTPIVPIK
jgi:hypothetical protein